MNKDIARQLDEAAQHAVSVPQVAAAHNINLEEAYKIQRLSMGRRYQRGEQSIGVKLGFTSRAKMEQMGVSDMIWGWLTDSMLYQDTDTLSLHKFIHPRAEPEVCYIVSKEINKALSLDEAKDHIGSLAVAIEIIDSRFQNFKFSELQLCFGPTDLRINTALWFRLSQTGVEYDNGHVQDLIARQFGGVGLERGYGCRFNRLRDAPGE